MALRSDKIGNEATGAFTVEDGLICREWNRPDDYKSCNRVYRIPKGIAEGLNQYLMVGTCCICAFRVEEQVNN